MRLLDWFEWLRNGGLDPATADPSRLRERRTISSTAFLLLPVGAALVIANTIVFQSSIENFPILVVMALAVMGVYLQAKFGWSKLAAHMVIIVFWLAPTALLLQTGLNSSNWVWMLPISFISILLGGRRAGLVWTIIAMLTLCIFSGLTLIGYLELGLRPDQHAKAITISGPLILAILYIAGSVFRTAQIQAEVKLNAHVSQLASEVDTRRAAEEAATAADKAKAVFLATVSHELRTPLNGVIGAGQLLKYTVLTDEQSELTEAVTSSGEILLDLINNVLDLSKLEAGKLEVDFTVIEMDNLVKSVLAPFRILADEKAVIINHSVAEDVPNYIISDVIRLRQIILNLVGNALKFTKQGQIDVRVSTENKHIKIQIEDTGIGMSMDKIARLFQPFSQAESSTARRYGGSGLGLTIVSELVQLLKGEIEFKSELGVGTVCTVLLPLVVGNAPTEQADDSKPKDKNLRTASENDTLTVLVADDNAVNRLVAKKMLLQLSHEVLEAKDGIEALELIKHNSIDAILMDVQMPKMDGLVATQKIRQMHSPKCDTFIIGLTANAMESDKADVMVVGMNDYLSKPVRQEQLESALGAIHAS